MNIAKMLGLKPRMRASEAAYREKRAATQQEATAKSKRFTFKYRNKTVKAGSLSEARAAFKEMFGMDRIPAGERPSLVR